MAYKSQCNFSLYNGNVYWFIKLLQIVLNVSLVGILTYLLTDLIRVLYFQSWFCSSVKQYQEGTHGTVV